MAVFTSFNKNFEVTAISFSPNIITVGEETSYSISIKNVSGKKISGMYAQLKLFYKATDGKVHGSNSVFVYGGPGYDLKSISWASGSTKTFTGKFVFMPISAYPPDIDTRLLPLYKGSDAGYSAAFGGNERLGLMLNITTNTTFNDGSNTDLFFDLRGASSEYLYVIDARYTPSIAIFAAERSAGSEPNNEGENLLADIALGKSAAARPEFMTLYLYYRDKATPVADPAAVNLTSLIPSALSGEIQTVISETLNKNADWDLVLWFGDQYESAAAAIVVSKSFANVHLSGASTGGVCFGSFSKSTEGNPLFECYYPARFFEGIRGVNIFSTEEVATGGRWIDGKRIYRKTVSGSVSTTSGTAKTAVIATIADVAAVVNMFGIVDRGGSLFPIVLYAGDNNHHRTSYSSGNVQFTSTHSATAYVTVEYTKTTD